jgi:hypothetical protein
MHLGQLIEMKRLTLFCGPTSAVLLLGALAAACGAGVTSSSPGANATWATTSTITATSSSGSGTGKLVLLPRADSPTPTPVAVLGSMLWLSEANDRAVFRVRLGTVVNVHFSAQPPAQVGVPVSSDPLVLRVLPGSVMGTSRVSASFRAAQAGMAKLTSPWPTPPCSANCGREDGVSEWLVTILVQP